MSFNAIRENKILTKISESTVQVSPVTVRRLGSTNLIRDIRGTRINEFRKKNQKKIFFFFLILRAKAETSLSGPENLHTLFQFFSAFFASKG